MKKARIILSLFMVIQSVLHLEAQNQKHTTIMCNPINLNYRFQLENPSRREAADPVVVLFKDKYFMFASKSGGYWVSDDLVNWSFITTTDLPLEDYAPTALVMNDAVYFMALDRKIYKSTNPLTGRWIVIKENFPFYAGDPCLFLDDDGRLYLYHGLSPAKPIKGIELNTTTFEPIGEEVEFMKANKDIFGWERTGDFNTESSKTFVEGAWMTKHNNKYYLQYSVPGTQYKSYADAVYVGDSPLGVFKVADTNPFSYKPEGFIAGAGHGNTFQDKWGNYWRAVSMTIASKHRFERRLGLFPAFFDKDGTFYTNTVFGDYPHYIPRKRMNKPEDYQPVGMLLSYNKPIEASSSSINHPKEHAADEEIRTYWSAKTGNKGEWILVDLKNKSKIKGVQLNFAEEESNILGRTESIYYQYLLEYSNDKRIWKTLSDMTTNTTDFVHDYVELKNPVTARYLRLTNYHVPDGKFAISGFRVFGKANGKLPQPTLEFKAVRDTADARNVTLYWLKNADATGYNIRYGVSPDKLYLNYQVLGANSLTIHSLSTLQNYYFTIDTFNESGITKSNKVIETKTLTKYNIY